MLSYDFSSGGAISSYGIPPSLAERTQGGDGPVPSTGSVFSSITDIIKQVGQTIKDVRNPGPGGVSSTTANTVALQTAQQKTVLTYGVLAIIAVLVVIAVLK